MRAKVLKINELNINKHKFKPKVKCFKSRTTLILNVVHNLKNEKIPYNSNINSHHLKLRWGQIL